MVDLATDTGEKRIDGRLLHVWELTTGTALLIDDDRREHTEVPITKAQAKEAAYTFILRFINGRTMAVFTLGGREYAQPLHLESRDGRRAPKREPAPKAPSEPARPRAQKALAEPRERPAKPAKPAPGRRRARNLDPL